MPSVIVAQASAERSASPMLIPRGHAGPMGGVAKTKVPNVGHLHDEDEIRAYLAQHNLRPRFHRRKSDVIAAKIEVQLPLPDEEAECWQ